MKVGENLLNKIVSTVLYRIAKHFEFHGSSRFLATLHKTVSITIGRLAPIILKNHRSAHDQLRWDASIGLVKKPLQHYRIASKCYKSAIKLNPLRPRWYLHLGICQEKLQEWDAAVETYKAGLRVDPQNEDLAYRLGFALEKLYDWGGAIEAYSQAKSLGRNDATINNRLGRLYEKQKDWLNASRSYRESSSSQYKLAGQDNRSFSSKYLCLLEAKEITNDLLKDTLGQTVLFADRFSDRWWNAAYNRLFQDGFVEAAYKARRISALLAASAKGGRKTDRVLDSICAKIWLGEVEEAVNVLKAASKKHKNEAWKFELLEADIHLLLGDLDRALSIWSHSYIDRQSRSENAAFSRLIEGKSIAIVGPANSGDGMGSEIDRHDIIVRTNFFDDASIKSNAMNIGSRTDVSYYNISFEKSVRPKLLEAICGDKLKFVVLRRPVPLDVFRQYNERVPTRVIGSEFKCLFRATSLGIPRMIYDLIHFRPSSITVYNVDFYTNFSEPYFNGYRLYQEDELALLASHDIVQNFMITKQLYERKIIHADRRAGEILSWDLQKYLDVMSAQIAAYVGRRQLLPPKGVQVG